MPQRAPNTPTDAGHPLSLRPSLALLSCKEVYIADSIDEVASNIRAEHYQ